MMLQNKTVTWSSSSTNIATVDTNGRITGVSEGTSTITVTTTDGSKTATSEVTVKIYVTDISLNKVSLLINKDQTETLVATILPANATNKAFSWSSS